MKSRCVWRWLAAGLLAAASARAAGTNRAFATTISSSRQFVVYAPNVTAASALCAYAEQIKREWQQRLGPTDLWRDSIVFIVRDREGDLTNAPVLATQTVRFDPRLRYQLTFVVPPAPDDATFVAATVEALCAELANRDQPRVRNVPYLAAPIPVWLTEGLGQSILGRADQLLTVVRRSAAGSRPQTAMELMSLSKLPGDAPDRALYRANVWFLTEALLRLPGGTQKLQRLLTELGATKTFGTAFTTVYANDFPDTATLEQWWSDQLTLARDAKVAENYTMAETARQLDALLTVETETRPAFAQLWRDYQQPWLNPLLRDKLVRFDALNTYAHPLYRPVLMKYADAVRELLDVKLGRFRRAVAEATRLRRAVDQQARQIQETLDQAEQTYGCTATNEFAGFFRTLEQLEKFEQQRRNPISDYLDQFGQ
jgi:hypothetical protein